MRREQVLFKEKTMNTKVVLVMLLLAVVCMGSLATAATATGPRGVVLAEDDDLEGGPAEFAPLWGVICGEDAGEEGPAE